MSKIFNEKVEIQNNNKNQTTISLDESKITAGAKGIGSGELLLKNKSDGLTAVRLNATKARVKLVHDKYTISIDASTGKFTIQNADGVDIAVLNRYGNLVLGGAKKENDTITKGVHGDLIIQDKNGDSFVIIDNTKGTLKLGGNRGKDKKNATIKGLNGQLKMYDNLGNKMIHLDGAKGDIILNNADFAEDFDVIPDTALAPGTVMSLSKEGYLQASDLAYDSKVVGVVAGAGNFKPGIIMDKQENSKNRAPISMLGKVECKADTSNGAIQIGDLLTSSNIPGHAMKVNDPTKAIGAIIGKAMSPLNEKTGMIKMLICLQ